MTLRVAIVGCGKIADGHVEEIQKMPELAKVVAACDLEPLMAEQLAMRYGIPHHSASFDEVLAEHRPDVVHIATPPGPHLALTKRALEAGCHVLVEKPLTPTYAEAQDLIEAVRRSGKKFTIGHTYYFDPPAVVMRDLIAQGVIGDPVHVESYYGYSLAGPFGSALLRDASHWVHRLPGQLLQNNVDHLLNKVTEFFRDDEPTVAAFGSVRREQRFGDVRDEFIDELRLVLRGSRVSAYATFSAHAKPAAHFLRVYGTKNTVHVDHVARTVTLEAPPNLPSALGRLLPPWHHALQFVREGAANVLRFTKSDFHFFAGLNNLLRGFYTSINEDGAPPISYEDILWLSRICDEVYRQVKARPRSGVSAQGVQS